MRVPYTEVSGNAGYGPGPSRAQARRPGKGLSALLLKRAVGLLTGPRGPVNRLGLEACPGPCLEWGSSPFCSKGPVYRPVNGLKLLIYAGKGPLGPVNGSPDLSVGACKPRFPPFSREKGGNVPKYALFALFSRKGRKAVHPLPYEPVLEACPGPSGLITLVYALFRPFMPARAGINPLNPPVGREVGPRALLVRPRGLFRALEGPFGPTPCPVSLF